MIPTTSLARRRYFADAPSEHPLASLPALSVGLRRSIKVRKVTFRKFRSPAIRVGERVCDMVSTAVAVLAVVLTVVVVTVGAITVLGFAVPARASTGARPATHPSGVRHG